MKISLIEILRNALVGKKIKLYKVLDKTTNKNGLEYYLIDLGEKPHPTKCEVISESHGFIKSINAEYVEYEGDLYLIEIVDDNGQPLHFKGLNSVTSKLEIFK